MSDPPKVAAARIEVERTRAALLETARELQQRLQPKTLANEAWEKAKNKGADLAEDAVDAVKKRPVAVGGVVAALTMFLAREPIKDAAIKFYDAMTSSQEPKRKAAALKAKQAQPNRPAAGAAARPTGARARRQEEDGESMMAQQQQTNQSTLPRRRRANGRSMPMTRARARLGHGPARTGRLGGCAVAGAWRRAGARRAGRRACCRRREPRSELMGKVGGRITDSARAAADAAKEAGREKLTELNITRDAGARRGPVADRRAGEAAGPGPGGARRGPQQGLIERRARFDASGPAMSKLHLVFGGRVKDPQGLEFVDLENIDLVGLYDSYAAAEDAWRGAAQRTVDDAEMKYVVVHLHRLLEPDMDGISRPKDPKD